MLKIVDTNIKTAWNYAISNSQIKFALILVIIFPLLFTYALQQFLNTANQQVETALKKQLNTLHYSAEILVKAKVTPERMTELLTSQTINLDLLDRFLVAKETSEGLRIISSSKPDEVKTIIATSTLYKSAIAQPNDLLIYKTFPNNQEVWLAFRSFELEDERWYIHTEINLASMNNVRSQREFTAYSALALIFVFLISLVWWLWRQQDYKIAHSEAEKKLHEQHDFSNMMVHELRAPLTAIKGYASMLIEANSLSPEQANYSTRILQSAERLVNLVSDFLEVSRIQAGALKITPSETNISGVVEKVASELLSSAEEKGLKVVTTTPLTPVSITTDPNRLHQVITNLLSNAIKYTDSGSISVILNSKPREVEIRIQDTGKGISAEDQSKLFKPFVRVGNADSSTTVGSGLGMWITKQLVAILGGSITIESITGVGTHAVVKLPQLQNKKKSS